MDIPASMRAELAAWNNGGGVDLEGYVSGMGSFALAVGYTTVFWPEFVEFEGYILPAGAAEAHVRQWEDGARPRSAVEWLMNHIHIAHIHMFHSDTTKDKLLVLGTVLKEIYEAKLRWRFPERPCVVAFHIPENEDDLMEYQLSFWQIANEGVPTPVRRT